MTTGTAHLMRRVAFAGLDRLPVADLRPEAGPACAAFVERGLRTTADAAGWLRELPYGRNASTGPMAVFTDGVGTCTTKHAAYLTAAAELDLDASLVWGVYALDASVVTGVRAILDRHGLPFVPMIHCFIATPSLGSAAFMDLTEGNCTGKNLQIIDYLKLVDARVGADTTATLATVAAELSERDPRFRGTPPQRILEAQAECRAMMTAACAVR